MWSDKEKKSLRNLAEVGNIGIRNNQTLGSMLLELS